MCASCVLYGSRVGRGTSSAKLVKFGAEGCSISGRMVSRSSQRICRVLHILAALIGIIMPLPLLRLQSLDLVVQICREYPHLLPMFLRATSASVSTLNILQQMNSNFVVQGVDHRDVSRFLRKKFCLVGIDLQHGDRRHGGRQNVRLQALRFWT